MPWIHNWETSLAYKWLWEKLNKNGINPKSYTMLKTQTKLNFNLWSEIIKLLESTDTWRYRENLHGIHLDNDVLTMTASIGTKSKNKHVRLYWTKMFLSSKEIISKMKKMAEYVYNYTWDERLISKIYKKFL
jgi:hypothetical protein